MDDMSYEGTSWTVMIKECPSWILEARFPHLGFVFLSLRCEKKKNQMKWITSSKVTVISLDPEKKRGHAGIGIEMAACGPA